MNRKVISLAVVAALTAGTAANAANQILFPFFKQGAGVHTILTVVNSAGKSVADPKYTNAIHTIYMYKGSEGKLEDACSHMDQYARMSPNDKMQWTVQDPKEGGFDVAAYNGGDKSTPVYLPKFMTGKQLWKDSVVGFAIMAPKNLTLEAITDDAKASTLYGFANVVDTGTGLSYSYHAISNDFIDPTPLSPKSIDEGNFAVKGDTTTTAVKAPFGSDQYVFQWSSLSAFDADWYVLVPSSNMAAFVKLDPNYKDLKTKAASTVAIPSVHIKPGLTNMDEANLSSVEVRDYAAAVRIAPKNGAAYDNDEVPYTIGASGASGVKVVCNGVVKLSNFTSDPALAKGGWVDMEIRSVEDLDKDGKAIVGAEGADLSPTALIWKIESIKEKSLMWGAGQNSAMSVAPENRVERPTYRTNFQ